MDRGITAISIMWMATVAVPLKVNTTHHPVSVFATFLLPQFLFFFCAFRERLLFFSLLFFKALFHSGALDL